METNPYEYDGYDQSVPWKPQQNHEQNRVYEPRYVLPRSSQQLHVAQNQRLSRGGAGLSPKPPKPMPKARALALVGTFKRWLVVASLAGFLSFSGLAAFHQVGTAASQTSSTTSSSTSTSSSQQSSNSFLKQHGGNNIGTTGSSQGSSSRSTSSSSSAVSGSSVS